MEHEFVLFTLQNICNHMHMKWKTNSHSYDAENDFRFLTEFILIFNHQTSLKCSTRYKT